MAKKSENVWLLETFRDVEYHVPRMDPKYNAMCEAFEKGELEEKFPVECKRLAGHVIPTPERLHDQGMYMSGGYGTPPKETVVKYVTDEDGTFTIDNEDDAIYLYKKMKALDERVHFNEKYGLPMPRRLKEELEAVERDRGKLEKRQSRLRSKPRIVGAG